MEIVIDLTGNELGTLQKELKYVLEDWKVEDPDACVEDILYKLGENGIVIQ